MAELLKKYDAPVLRLALGTVHHRSTVEFSDETLADAAALWERLSGAVLRAREVVDDPGRADASDAAAVAVDASAEEVRARALPAEYAAAMDDDLGLAGAMAVVHATLKRLNTALAAPSPERGAVVDAALDLRSQLDVLGLDPSPSLALPGPRRLGRRERLRHGRARPPRRRPARPAGRARAANGLAPRRRPAR